MAEAVGLRVEGVLCLVVSMVGGGESGAVSVYEGGAELGQVLVGTERGGRRRGSKYGVQVYVVLKGVEFVTMNGVDGGEGVVSDCLRVGVVIG